MAITVEATQRGYYGNLREPGDRFDIVDKQAFSTKWMRRVSDKATAEVVTLPVEPTPEGDAALN